MLKRFAVLSLILAALPAHAGKVRMCADDACTEKVSRKKLDCTVHKNKKKSLTFGFKLSVAFAAKVGPEATFGRSSEINWNRMSQDLIRRYEELCDFHNKGLLSVTEFDRRYAKLDEHYDKAKDLKEQVEDTVETRAAGAYSALDKEAKKHRDDGDPAAAMAKIATFDKEIAELAAEVKDFKAGPEPAEKTP